MTQQKINWNLLFAGLRKLRPVLRDGRIEVELP